MNKDIRAILLQRKIVTDGGCWLYTGGLTTNGYGSIKYKGKTQSVHRLSLELFKGVIFQLDEQANHIRECPNRHCFNPDHLYKGTQTDNMEDLGSRCSLCGNPKRIGKKCQPCRIKYNAEYYRRNNKHRKDFGRE